MENRKDEEIRQEVRNTYGRVAKEGMDASDIIQAASCCGTPDTSGETAGIGSCCGSGEYTPEKMSSVMGYSKVDMDNVPGGANLGLGCGNPVALASLQPGELVVDLGSGGGFDCFLAAKKVGENGNVIGVDMTADMVSKARNNAEKAGVSNVEFRLGEIEHLP